METIGGETLIDLRDKAFLSVMLYSFSRVSAVVGLKVRDYEHQRRRAYLALHEKGGQHRRVPVHSRAAEALDAYLAASGLGPDRFFLPGGVRRLVFDDECRCFRYAGTTTLRL